MQSTTAAAVFGAIKVMCVCLYLLLNLHVSI